MIARVGLIALAASLFAAIATLAQPTSRTQPGALPTSASQDEAASPSNAASLLPAPMGVVVAADASGISVQWLPPVHTGGAIESFDDSRHPLAVLGLHHAGAQAHELTDIPLAHRGRALAHVAGKRGDGEVQVLARGRFEQGAGATRRLARRGRLHGPGDDVELGRGDRHVLLTRRQVVHQRQGTVAAGAERVGELAAALERQQPLRRPQRNRRCPGARAFQRNLPEVQFVRAEVGVGRIVPVMTADGRVAKQYAAAAVGLQPVLVRIDDDGIGRVDGGEGARRIGIEVVDQPEVAAVCGVDVKTKVESLLEHGNLVERVHRAGGGGTERCDHGADIAQHQQLLERLGVHAATRVHRHGNEPRAEHGGQPRMRVVRLPAGGDGAAAGFLARHPQRLEVGHGAAPAQVAEVPVHAEHPGDFGHRLLFHARTGATAVERMVVGIHVHGERVGQPRHRVRRLEHLAEVERMLVGVVVLQSRRGGVEHRGNARVFHDRQRRQRPEAVVEAAQRVGKPVKGLAIERGHVVPACANSGGAGHA